VIKGTRGSVDGDDNGKLSPIRKQYAATALEWSTPPSRTFTANTVHTPVHRNLSHCEVEYLNQSEAALKWYLIFFASFRKALKLTRWWR
jgi:hypothetical protein